MGPAKSAVRSACDQCHSRKLRCTTTQQRNICDRCEEHETPCTFSPAGRNGRPPRTQTATEGVSRQATPTALSSSTSNSSYNVNRDYVAPNGRSNLSRNTISQPNSDTMLDPTLESWSDLSFPYWNNGAGMSNLVDQLTPSLSIDMMAPDVFSRSSASTPASFEMPSCWDPQLMSNDTTTAAPTTSSAHETLSSLHSVQQQLHKETCSQGLSLSASSSDFNQPALNSGPLFQTIDEMHGVLQQCFDCHSHLPVTSWCDFSTAMAITTSMGNVVEVYEMIVRRNVLKAHPACSNAGSIGQTRSSAYDYSWTQNSTTSTQQGERSASKRPGAVSMPTTPLLRDIPTFPVQIGNFTLSEDVGRRVVADVLLEQISVSQKVLDRLRRTLMQADSQLAPSACASSTALSRGAEHGHPAESMEWPPSMFFTSELQSTVVHLMNQLEIRMSKLKGGAIGAARRTGV